jgi:hypothetical protein
MEFPVTYGKSIIDSDFNYRDYDKEYIGEEYGIKRYRVIRTFARDYNVRKIREVRDVAQNSFKVCHNVETLRNEDDIYSYLSESDNLLIGILENNVYYMYCLSRSMMSKRAMNNKNFRYNHRGKDYVKFLPKTWTSEEGFQALLNSDYSIYLFKSLISFDSLIGNVMIEDDDEENLDFAQRYIYGTLVELDKAWDLLYFERILYGSKIF